LRVELVAFKLLDVFALLVSFYFAFPKIEKLFIDKFMLIFLESSYNPPNLSIYSESRFIELFFL